MEDNLAEFSSDTRESQRVSRANELARRLSSLETKHSDNIRVLTEAFVHGDKKFESMYGAVQNDPTLKLEDSSLNQAEA